MSPFAEALDHLLRDVEAANEDAYPWQAAISVLREQAGALCTARAPTTLRQVAESLIDQARVRISERLRSRLYEMTEEIKLAGVPDFRTTFRESQHH